MPDIRLFKTYYPALFWALFTLLLCGMNGSSLPQISFDIGIDKIAHFILFGIQAWLLVLPVLAGKKENRRVHIHLAVWLSVTYGVLIEFLQATVFVNRSFDYADMLADAAGAFCCYLPARWLLRLKQ